ncbi:MAG: site-specific integrase [Flavobacteriales bacterium]|nr:site-specific integrase [Flavobacteriales bacterium]
MSAKKFNTLNPESLIYQNEILKLTVLGGIKLEGLDRMRSTLKIELKNSSVPPVRHNLDLYNDTQTEKLIRKTAEKLEIGTSVIAASLSELIEQLEAYRLDQIKKSEADSQIITKVLSAQERQIYIGGSRKSNERTLELKSNQIIELMEYQYTTRNELLKYREAETDLLFLSTPTAGKLKATGSGKLDIWKSLRNDIRKYNPKFINFKQVRTSVITHWLKQYNLRQVQQMAGHRYVSSTEAYLVNQTEDLQKDIDEFHPF